MKAPKMKKPKKGAHFAMTSPLVSADFVSGVYEAGGISVAVTDLFAADAEIGCTFDPADIISGNGLRGQLNGGASLPAFIGPLFSALHGTDGCTVVAEFDCSAAPSSGAFGVDMFNSPDWDLDVTAIISEHEGNYVLSYAASVAVDPSVGVVTFSAFASGRVKVAMTYREARVAASLNGDAVIDVTPSTPPNWSLLNKAYIGNSFVADYLRSIAVYAPQDDATLVSLSSA
jgi:hypothetical protein